jgi:hypothetical protein
MTKEKYERKDGFVSMDHIKVIEDLKKERQIAADVGRWYKAELISNAIRQIETISQL